MSELNNPFGETNHGVVQQAVKTLINESNDQDKRLGMIEDAIVKIEASIRKNHGVETPVSKHMREREAEKRIRNAIDSSLALLDRAINHFAKTKQ